METINAKNVFNEKYLKSFLTRCNNEDIHIFVNNEHVNACKKQVLVQTLFELSKLDDADEVSCRADNATLLLAGIDITWWSENTRRKNKLLKVYDDVSVFTSAKMYTVAAGTMSQTDNVTQIKTFTGTKQDVIAFFNSEIKSRYIDNFLQNKIVFDLCYSTIDDIDLNAWFTLDELIDAGLIELR